MKRLQLVAQDVPMRSRDLLGVPADRQQGLQVLQFWMEQLHPDDRERILDVRRQLHDRRLERLDVAYRFLHLIHGERWLHHVARVVRRDATGRPLTSFGVLRDITQAKRAEEVLRELSRRLILAHEDERALLARELHDDVTRRLAVLAIDVGRAEIGTPSGPHVEPMRSVRVVRRSTGADGLSDLRHDPLPVAAASAMNAVAGPIRDADFDGEKP